MLEINIIPCLQDNYSYIVKDASSGLVGVVDPSEFKPVDDFIKEKFNKIDFILNTHHHFDHTGGNLELKKKYNCKIVGSSKDESRIPGIDTKLRHNEIFKFGNIEFKIILVPGHTSGHICFYSVNEKIIFTGDTLFSLGCGKIFEGTYNQMYESLSKLKNLPLDTKIYCGHEYTLQNSKFCIEHDPLNQNLINKILEVKKKINNGTPTLPTTLEDELKCNIFLRANDVKNFSKLRDLKDNF